MIYFDNSATTKPYKEVVDSFVKVSTDFFGNPSSLHHLGAQAEHLLMQARLKTAGLLNVKATKIFFTSGGTESNNLALKGTALVQRGRGRHIITTSVEHASVSKTMAQLEELNYEITFLPVNSQGRVSAADIESAIRPDTILVSVMHVNNEIGSIQPVREIGNLLKKHSKILFHVDNVQGIGKVPLDLYEAGIDLCSFSAHKFHGLKGTGALFIREGVRISPLFSGGNQEWKTRSGTENVAGMVAMAKALRIIMSNQEKKLPEMNRIMECLRTDLEKMNRVAIHTPKEHAAPHILNFSIEGFKAEVFVHALEEKKIYVSTTSACSSKKKSASKTLLAIGVPEDLAGSAIRISLSYDNTMEEAFMVLEAIKQAVNTLGEVMS